MKTIAEETERATVRSKMRVTPKVASGSNIPVPISVKTILVPLDFSRAAMQALDYATALGETIERADSPGARANAG